ncbi:MAG: NADH-quinone oxidoreductase subunit M [Candidatus Hadarchaeales archaeon]
MIESAPILAVVLPLFAAFLTTPIGILARRLRMERARDWFAVAAMAATFAIVASMAPAVRGSGIFVYKLGGWSPPWGINLVVDGLSLLMALIIAGICFLVAIYSITYMQRRSGLDQYYTLLLLITAGMMGVSLTGDIFNFYVFLEIMCISTYALVAFDREWESIEASVKYLIIGSVGTSLLLLGIVLVYGCFGSLNIADLMIKLKTVESTGSMPIILVLALSLFVTGFCVKAAVVPMHAWLADAHPAAPTSISALLSGVFVTIGAYGMLRLVYAMFGTLAIGSLLVGLGLASMLIGALMALAQRDIKRLIAYSTVSQMGYIFFGIGLGTTTGIQGGLFHLLNNAIMKALLFMCAGAIIHRTGRRELDEMGGLGKNMPITTVAFAVGALATAGVPPLNGFASKWMLYMAGVEAGGPYLFAVAMAVLVSVLTLAYLAKAFASVFLGQRPRYLENVKEVPALMLFPICLLAALCVVLGILPQLGIAIARPAQEAVMQIDSYVKSVLGGA